MADWLSVGASFVPEPSRHRRRDGDDNDTTESFALQVYRNDGSKRHGKEEKRHKKKSSSSRKTERGSRKRPRAASSASDAHSSSSSGNDEEEKDQQLVRYKERHLKKHRSKSKWKKKKSSSSSRRRHSDSSDSDSDDDRSHRHRRKDHRRLRASEEHKSSKYSQVVVASAPKEVQVWMQNTVDDHDATNGSSKLFEFDCAGDRENRFYGTLYAQDKPLYTLATRRNLFTGKWLVERKPAVQQQQLTGGGDRDAKKVEERSSNRYFGASARQMERNSRQQRLYLAYSEKRLARQRGDPSASTELAYIPLDPVIEPTHSQDDGGDNELLRTETANTEQYLVTRSKLFHEALKQNPRDIDTWLDFVAFQEQALRLTRPSKGSQSSLSTMVVDKQAAILEKAIEANPDNRELQLVKLKLALRNLNTVNSSSSSSNGNSASATATTARNHETLRTQLEAMIEKDPTNGDLWSQQVLTRQQNFASFSVPLLRDVYARIIAILRKEMTKLVQDEAGKEKLKGSSSSSASSSSVQIFDAGSLLASTPIASFDSVMGNSEKVRELVRLLLEFHLRLCSLEQKAGHTERSIAQLQALLDFNSMGSSSGTSLGNGGSLSEHRHAELLREFTVRWDQNLPHFGDDTRDLATASTFIVENAFLPPSDALVALVYQSLESQMTAMYPAQAIWSHEHQQSLLRLAGIHQRSKGSVSLQPGDDGEGEQSDDDDQSSDGAALIYSNVHGYRIKLDEIDDTSEYERILSELRGTEASIAKQQSQGKKKELRKSKSAKGLAKFHDERADFDAIDCEDDAFCQWLRQEQAIEMSQWLPLRSSNPEHQEQIHDAPDRAVLAEEIQPFLFQVPRVMRLTLVLNLLKFVGLQWLNNVERAHQDTTTSVENLYADSCVDEYEELVKPILSAMDPSSTESILLTTAQRRDLLQQALLDDVCVSKSALVDAGKVVFIRNVFVRFLDLLHSEGDRESMRLVKYLWIAFDANLVSNEDSGDTGLQHARQLCQKLMENGESATSSHGPDPCADVVLMFAYAKLELRAGNTRQVNRICDKTLMSLALHSFGDAQMDRGFHALLFLRVRSELWQPAPETTSTDEELRKLKTLYILWSAWQPLNDWDSLEKQFRKAPAKLKKHLHDVLLLKSNGGVKTTVVEKYRLELEIATQQRTKQSKRSDSGNGLSLKQSDWFSTVSYCVYNLCLAIYATAGFQAACSEFQVQISMLYWNSSPSEHRWLRLSYLEFIQQHQLSSTFPIVAPRDWRLAVGETVERFPHDPLLLRLYVDAETSNTMSQSLRMRFQSVRMRWQRHFDSPLVVEWLFALLCEFSRLERSVTPGEAEPGSSLSLSTTPEPRPGRCCLFHKFGSNLTGIERVRRVFQEMVENSRTQGNALCWRLYVRFEVQMGKVDTARRVFYRGLAKCPWSKALYLDGVRVLRPYLSEAECKELADFMAAKELHVRVEDEDE